jgi:hypothetical protein
MKTILRSPTRADPIPELIHFIPEWTRPYPARYRSLYIILKFGTDPIRSDTGACGSSTGMNPILPDPVPEPTHYDSVCNRSFPIRYRSLFILYPTALILSAPIPELRHPLPVWIRSDAKDVTPSSGINQILFDPIPKVNHPFPEWIRSYPIRYRRLYLFFRNGPDLIRPDTTVDAYYS